MKRKNKGTKHKFKEDNLVSLVWPTNKCYSRLISGPPKGVTVDLDKGTWTFKGKTGPIGSRMKLPVTKDYPIGVYDYTKIGHLQSMKSDIEWVRERGRVIPIDA